MTFHPEVRKFLQLHRDSLHAVLPTIARNNGETSKHYRDAKTEHDALVEAIKLGKLNATARGKIESEVRFLKSTQNIREGELRDSYKLQLEGMTESEVRAFKKDVIAGLAQRLNIFKQAIGEY